jgi:hypothetical protein
MRFNSGENLLKLKRFGDVVHTANRKSIDLVLDIVEGADEAGSS